MLKALLRLFWPPVPYRLDARFERHTMDQVGAAALRDFYIDDARVQARAGGWAVDETWAVEVLLLDLYRPERARPDDVLQLTVKLVPPT